MVPHMKEDSGSNPGGGFIFFVFWNVHASRQNKYNLKKKKREKFYTNIGFDQKIMFKVIKIQLIILISNKHYYSNAGTQ